LKFVDDCLQIQAEASKFEPEDSIFKQENLLYALEGSFSRPQTSFFSRKSPFSLWKTILHRRKTVNSAWKFTISDGTVKIHCGGLLYG